MILPNTRQSLELGDIFRDYGSAYRASHSLPLYQLKAMGAIEACRTQILGGHLEVCENCGVEVPAYNSCRNRHCPKCGWLVKEKWLMARKNELLPVSYFHVVLTLPDLLNPLVLYNQRQMYDLLFRAGSETLLALGRDPKHLGGEIGFIAILHTWGQNLIDHPHLHCLMPCGGLSEDEMEWNYPKKSKKKKKFFVHVHVISDLFKKKYLHYLNEAYQAGELKLEGEIAHLEQRAEFKQLLDKLYEKQWVTYCKNPLGGPELVLEYLSRYIHRVAISNHRLIKIEDGRVYFKWKNYRKGDRLETTSLEVNEFIRRFLLHILPPGYFRIRYYGLLASRNREKLRLCQEILGAVPLSKDSENHEEKSWQELFWELTGIEPERCPYCKKGRLITIARLKPVPP